MVSQLLQSQKSWNGCCPEALRPSVHPRTISCERWIRNPKAILCAGFATTKTATWMLSLIIWTWRLSMKRTQMRSGTPPSVP